MDKPIGDQDEGEVETRRCAACQRELRMGDDCLSTQQGVIGPRGFVLLGDKTYLCDHVCAECNFCSNSAPAEKLPRRIP